MGHKKEDHIVVDVEIVHNPETLPDGWNSTERMLVACAVVYEYQRDRYVVYTPQTDDDDLARLKDRIKRADRVTGFNTWRFDYPVIFGLPGRERVEDLAITCDDLLRRVWIAEGFDPDRKFMRKMGGYGLERICVATLGKHEKKLCEGSLAPALWHGGLYGQVITYCMDDVRKTRLLVDYADKKKTLKVDSPNHARLQSISMALDWRQCVPRINS